MLPDQFGTTRLTFRPLAAEDAPLIFDTYAQDMEVARYMTWRPHRSLAETESYVTSALSGGSQTHVLQDREDGRLNGVFEVRQFEPHRLGFGYLLARPYWGNGLMTEALAAVVEWCLSQQWPFGVSVTYATWTISLQLG